jgi:hypothetical protein
VAARKDRDTYIWGEIEIGISRQGLGYQHHLRKHEQILEIMCDFFCHELNKVWDQLMKARILLETG